MEAAAAAAVTAVDTAGLVVPNDGLAAGAAEHGGGGSVFSINGVCAALDARGTAAAAAAATVAYNVYNNITYIVGLSGGGCGGRESVPPTVRGVGGAGA